MRRLITLVAPLVLVIGLAGTASAAPNRSATVYGCASASGLNLTVDWAGYHPDTLRTMGWESSTPSATWAYSPDRFVDWKFGTSTYDTSFANWSAAAPTLAFTPDTMVAVRLYAHNRQVAETNAVRYGDLPACA